MPLLRLRKAMTPSGAISAMTRDADVTGAGRRSAKRPVAVKRSRRTLDPSIEARLRQGLGRYLPARSTPRDLACGRPSDRSDAIPVGCAALHPRSAGFVRSPQERPCRGPARAATRVPNVVDVWRSCGRRVETTVPLRRPSGLSSAKEADCRRAGIVHRDACMTLRHASVTQAVVPRCRHLDCLLRAWRSQGSRSRCLDGSTIFDRQVGPCSRDAAAVGVACSVCGTVCLRPPGGRGCRSRRQARGLVREARSRSNGGADNVQHRSRCQARRSRQS